MLYHLAMIYANENEPKAAHWMSCLPLHFDRIDSRSIVDVKGNDLDGFTQCHFFAGIAGWPYSLQLAGWPDDAEVWSGSCPCQPFSSAGKRKGTADERHLWPEFRRLIAECRPATIFGEQVASKAGRDWLAFVRSDLEALGYAVGVADLCAACAGAPHIRQRLFWVADSGCMGGRKIWAASRENQSITDIHDQLCGTNGGLGDAVGDEQRRTPEPTMHREWFQIGGSSGVVERLEHSESDGRIEGRSEPVRRLASVRLGEGFWGECDFLYCSDGKYRPVEPGTFPLASGISGRVAQLRGLGNSIVPALAAEFVRAFMETFDG